jgi:3-oxoacyl-[acyl-carrier-protein] synthase-1
LNPTDIHKIPLLLCLAEQERPRRIQQQDDLLIGEIQKILGVAFHSKSKVIANGRVAGVQTLKEARLLMAHKEVQYCVVAGTDTFLTADTLAFYEAERRILTESNSNGFIPGEAGTAVLLAPADSAAEAHILIKGVGFGREPSTVMAEQQIPFRAEGLFQATGMALRDTGRDFGALDFHICDVSGEQYGFKEGALALTRLLRQRKQEFDIWHPAEYIGETGAAIVPAVLGVASAAMEKGYAPGPSILCHFGNDDGQRGVVIVQAASQGSA